MPRIVERGVLLWTKKRPERSSGPGDQESRGLPWRIATGLAILATAVLIPVAYLVLWPSGAYRTQGRGNARIADEEVFDASEEEAAGQDREKITFLSAGIDRSPMTEENGLASLPDPREFFEELLRSVWDQTGSTPAGVRLGSTSLRLREALLKAFVRRPTEVEVLYMPPAGASGLCTLKVKDDQGHEGVIGIRLIRLKGEETPWEVESMVVMKPALPPRGRGSSR
jgi:hypothetical protein